MYVYSVKKKITYPTRKPTYTFSFCQVIQSWWRMPIINGYVCVETFLCMGGILTTYNLIKRFEYLKQFNVFVYYLSKFIR